MRAIASLLLCLALAAAAPTAQGESDDTLQIYMVDVEGGEATLFVAPSGESMLFDTGWPGFEGRDADRIAAAAADAGVTRIDKEHPLMCPDDQIGPIDLYLVSHHGSETSGSEALVHAIAPRAAIMNNGPRKGGAVQTFEILAAADNPPDLWQNHYSIPGGEAHNRPEQFIANLEEDTELADGRRLHMGTSHWIHVSARRDGSFTVTNSRNGFSRTYGPRQ